MGGESEYHRAAFARHCGGHWTTTASAEIQLRLAKASIVLRKSSHVTRDLSF